MRDFLDLTFLNGSFLDTLKRQAVKGEKSFADFDIYPNISGKKYLFSDQHLTVKKELEVYTLIVSDAEVVLTVPFKGSIWAKRLKILCNQPGPLQIYANSIITFHPCINLKILEHSPLISVGEWGLDAVKTFPQVREGEEEETGEGKEGFNILHLAALQSISLGQLQLELNKLDNDAVEDLLNARLTAFPSLYEDMIIQSMPRGLDVESYKRISMFRTPVELSEIAGSMFLYNYVGLNCAALTISLESVKRIRF